MWTERSGWRAATMVVALVAVGACGRGDRPDYSKHEDSGAVAPAMRLDTSLTRDRPDSNTSVRPADTTRRRP